MYLSACSMYLDSLMQIRYIHWNQCMHISKWHDDLRYFDQSDYTTCTTWNLMPFTHHVLLSLAVHLEVLDCHVMSCYVFRIFLAFRPRKNAICYPSGFLNHGGISDDLIKVEGNDEEEEMMSSLDKKFLARHMKPDENFFRCWLLASGNHDENESITGGRCATMKGMNVLVDLLLFLFWKKKQLLLIYFCTALVGASLWPVVPKSHNAAVVAEF